MAGEVSQAVEILNRGGLVAFPTETVYGLGADATSVVAVEKIFLAKGRPGTNPLIVHVADAAVARRYARSWPEAATKLAERFWPGPLTLVLPKAEAIVSRVTAGRDTVGLRAPDHPLAKKAAAMRGPIPIEELNGVDFVGFDEELPIRSDVDRFLKEKGVEVNVTVHFDNIQMIKEAVAHRVGVSIMPHRVMRDDIRQKRLTAIRLAGTSLYRPLGIIHRKTKRFQPVAQAFLDLLCEKPVPEAA